jgi:phage terminase small subunit
MPILKHAKYEIFAQEVAKGTSLEDAHVIAGYKRNASNASTLSRKPEIAGRITELKQLGATSAIKAIGVTKERIVAELIKIGFSNMLDYVRISEDGLPYCDFSAITRDQAAAIQEVNVEVGSAIEYNEKGERTAVPVRKVRFKLADKRAALIDMGKHLGMFKEEQIVPRVRTDKSIAELRDELLQDMVEAGLVTLLPAPEPAPAGVANRKDGTKH